MGQAFIGNQDHAILNNQTLREANVQSDRITLHFGAVSKVISIKANNEVELNNIVIPRKLTNNITIPDLPYEYYFIRNHLFIGPVIGMCVLPIYYMNPEKQLLRFSQYAKIKGLIFLFKERKINKISKTIEGFYYNPKSKSFVPGVFPYPSVIFNRVRMSSVTYNHLSTYVGNNIFNYPYGNTSKWAFWDQMSKYAKIKEHLPFTIKYTNDSLVSMLSSYTELYLKPRNLAGGNGILHIKKSVTGYNFTDLSGKTHRIKTQRLLLKRVKKRLAENRSYIIQQAIPFYHKGSKIDFRVYIQKDKSMKWAYSGMETKVANKGSRISNSKSRKGILRGEAALRYIYGLNGEQIVQKVKEISQLCIEVLQNIGNPNDHFGDAAVDMVIDKNHKLWLLEVQFNYAAEIKADRDHDERRVLPYILPTPFEYAKALTGF